MKTIREFAFVGAALFMSLMLTAACRKDNNLADLADNNPRVAELQAQAQNTLNAVVDMVTENALKSGALTGATTGGSIGTCPVVTYTPSGNQGNPFPATVKIDYGTGCTTVTGANAAGTITATCTGRLSQTNSQMSFTLSGFKYGSFTVSGNITLTMQGTSSTAFQSIKIEGSNLSAQTGGTSVIFSSLNMIRTQVGGQSTTPTNGQGWVEDDVYETQIVTCNGSATTTEIGTISFIATTTTNLHKVYSCKWTDKGIIEITVSGKKGTIDFGNGTCDNKATVKIGNVTKEVSLP